MIINVDSWIWNWGKQDFPFECDDLDFLQRKLHFCRICWKFCIDSTSFMVSDGLACGFSFTDCYMGGFFLQNFLPSNIYLQCCCYFWWWQVAGRWLIASFFQMLIIFFLQNLISYCTWVQVKPFRRKMLCSLSHIPMMSQCKISLWLFVGMNEIAKISIFLLLMLCWEISRGHSWQVLFSNNKLLSFQCLQSSRIMLLHR